MSITSGIIVTSPRPSEWVKKSRPTYRAPRVTASVGRWGAGSGARRGRPAAGVLAGLLPLRLEALVARAQRLTHALQALEAVDELVGHLARLLAAADDVGGNEDEQLDPIRRVVVHAEGPAEHRNIHEVGNTGPAVSDRIHDDAADEHGLSVLHDDGGLRLARRERRGAGAPEAGAADGAHLLPDLHVHQALRVDLRQDGEDVPGVAVLDRVDDVGD